MLTAAFARALRDPFVHARNAALLALAATVDLYSEDDCASKLLPAICPSLVDKEKLVRDQANKTLDTYLTRIRKHQTTLPDTVLSPASNTAASGPTPRMSTPQQENSWAGWAISSFTNKLAAATGDIQPHANGGGLGSSQTDSRSSSVPPAARPTSSTSTASALHRQATKPSNPFASASSTSLPATAGATPEAEPEDFGAEWGDDFGGEDANDDDLDAWGKTDDDHDPFGPPTTTSTTSSVPFDDKGEPDFAGWLTAQAQAKSAAKKPLPKGLSKPSAASKTAVKPAAAKPVAAVKKATPVVPASKKAPVAKKEVKKAEQKKAPAAEEEEMDDGWGDAWD